MRAVSSKALPSDFRTLLPLYLASATLTLGEGSFGLLVPPYMAERGVSNVAIGVAVSVYGLASLAARLPSGALYRTHRAAALIVSGCVLSALSFAAMTRTGDPVLLSVFVGLDGAGFAIATTASMAALIDRRPPGSNAGSIMGWYTGFIGAGYAAAGFLGGPLGDALGPRKAILVLALVPLAAGALLSLALRGIAPARGASTPVQPRSWLREFRGVAPLVWLAFFVTLYINLVSGVMLTFFPIYGLAIGLTLTQIGVLQGAHGLAAAAVRFLSGLVFSRISYQRTLPVMVVLSGASIALIAGVEWLAVLLVAWALLGLTRGLLRVASAALVMDESRASDAGRGASSGIYLAGLDLGKVLGPILGGAGGHLIGLRATFFAASISFPVLYFVLTAILRAKQAAAPPEPVADQ